MPARGRPPYAIRKVYGGWYTFRISYGYNGPMHHVIGKWQDWESALDAVILWTRCGA